MSDQVKNIDKIIARILSGEAQIDDVLQFSLWLSEDNAHLQEFLLLKSFWDASAVCDSSDYPEEAYEKHISEKLVFQPTGRASKYKTYIWAVAASIALLLGSFFVFRAYMNNEPVEYYTYYNSGEIYELDLADGTQVKLNQNSKLTYSNQYGKKDRSVTLEGEAYFDVKKDPNRVFKINMENKASIEVLGTKFNVQAYSGNPEIITTLEEGSIRFHSGNEYINLIQKQQLVYNKESGKTDVSTVEPELFIAWKDRLYRYHSIPMEDLKEELEKIFDVEIIIPQRLEGVKVSGSFIYGQSIEDILGIMQKSLAFKWKKQNQKIIIQ